MPSHAALIHRYRPLNYTLQSTAATDRYSFQHPTAYCWSRGTALNKRRRLLKSVQRFSQYIIVAWCTSSRSLNVIMQTTLVYLLEHLQGGIAFSRGFCEKNEFFRSVTTLDHSPFLVVEEARKRAGQFLHPAMWVQRPASHRFSATAPNPTNEASVMMIVIVLFAPSLQGQSYRETKTANKAWQVLVRSWTM